MTFPYFLLFLTLHLITSCASVDWCYDIQTQGSDCKGPSEWSEQCADYKQSPINIVTCDATPDHNLKPFQFEGYDKEKEFKLTNNGHSAEVELEEGAMKISGGGLSSTYTATQFHFHWGSEGNYGSEHSLNGEKYPIELHIVHTKNEGRSESSGGSTTSQAIAVLGFFLEAGSTNGNYKNLIEGLKGIPYYGNSTSVSIKPQDLIPEADDLELFYRYSGSLTTPACNETVTWTVFPKTIKLSQDQINAFYTSLKYKSGQNMTENFRPLQKRNTREIYTSGVDVILPHTTSLLIPLFLFYLTSIS